MMYMHILISAPVFRLQCLRCLHNYFFSHMLTEFFNSLIKAWDSQRGLFDLLLWLQMKRLKKPTCTGVCGHVRVFVCVFKS